MIKYKYITKNKDLDELIKLIKKRRIVALDTEFTRRTTYYPILSIIQVALFTSKNKKEFFIIDCLADLNLKKFLKIIPDKKIIKILHSASQDLQIFYQILKKMPNSIIDTQIMASFCKYGTDIGYARLVKEIFNYEIDKKHQRSNWQRRPLSKGQLEYASVDVYYLEEIYEKCQKMLKKNKRKKWYDEEVTSSIENYLTQNNNALFKNFAFKNKSKLELNKTKKLILLREKYAQKIDIPRQHLIKDEQIIRMASGFKCNLRIDKEVQGKVDKILKKRIFLREIKHENRNFYMNEQQKSFYRKAKSLISKVAKQEGFKEQFLITSFDLTKIICEEKAFNKIIKGWRKELFGKELKKIIT